MASRRSRHHESCAHEDCGSRRFHVGEDGFTYCDQGHQQSERGTVIVEDTGEMVQRGRTSRRKDSDAESVRSRTSSFSGSHAFEHYLLCVQLVLRKQLYYLINTQKLPNELEALVKDLWALRLQKVQSKITYESETDTEAASSQRFSSQSESEATAASRSTRRRRKQNDKVQEGSPRLMETVALCHVGLLFLRIPVTAADIHRWANDGELLYYRAAREVPLGMRERLPPRYQAQLEPQDLLHASSLHAEALKLLTSFSIYFGMSAPVLNLSLILYRWLRELMLPLEVFTATNRLAGLLEISFDFLPAARVGSVAVFQYPEARLMAVMVAATKLLIPFDNIERHARSQSDLSAMCMDWQMWMKENAARENEALSGDSPTFSDAFEFDEDQCHSASDDKLDTYLDWYQKNIATEDIRERGKAGKDAELRRAMFTMFPTHERVTQGPHERSNIGGQVPLETRLRKVQSKLRPRPVHDSVSSEAEIRPVGSCYRRFRNSSELAGVAKAFHEKAAELAGISLDEMVQAVFAVEKKMAKHEDRLRKSAGSH